MNEVFGFLILRADRLCKVNTEPEVFSVGYDPHRAPNDGLRRLRLLWRDLVHERQLLNSREVRKNQRTEVVKVSTNHTTHLRRRTQGENHTSLGRYVNARRLSRFALFLNILKTCNERPVDGT
ncbi:MAG: hypothetical protein ACE5H0_04365 [Bacteroidota bacterium]